MFNMYYILILLAVSLDQLTKYLVRTNMDLRQSIPVIEDVFHMTYIQNTGAAFSIFSGHTALLAVVTMIITAGIIIFMHKSRKSGHWSLLLSMALIVSGGIGNIIDRLSLGFVVDFFDFRVWPVFNVADIFVCTGCGILILYVFFIEPKLNAKKETE